MRRRDRSQQRLLPFLPCALRPHRQATVVQSEQQRGGGAEEAISVPTIFGRQVRLGGVLQLAPVAVACQRLDQRPPPLVTSVGAAHRVLCPYSFVPTFIRWQVRVRRAAGGVCRFHFDELCAARCDMGAADFGAICKVEPSK